MFIPVVLLLYLLQFLGSLLLLSVERLCSLFFSLLSLCFLAAFPAFPAFLAFLRFSLFSLFSRFLPISLAVRSLFLPSFISNPPPDHMSTGNAPTQAAALTGEPPGSFSIPIVESGYLMLAGTEAGAAALATNHATQHAAGATWIDLLSPQELSAVFPWCNTDDLLLGAYGRKNEGHFDPWNFLAALRAACRALGVRVVHGAAIGMSEAPTGTGGSGREERERAADLTRPESKTEFNHNTMDRIMGTSSATGRASGSNALALDPTQAHLLRHAHTAAPAIDTNSSHETGAIGVSGMAPICMHASSALPRVRAIHTSAPGLDATVPCDAVVVAGGAWSASVIALAQAFAPVADLPVRRRARSVFAVQCAAPPGPGVPPPSTPLTVDPSGVYFRPDTRAGTYLCGVSPDAALDLDWEGEDADGLQNPDHSLFENIVWPTLYERVPNAFDALRCTGAWAGFYDYNTLDQNAIIGAHPDLSNVVVATGFSGHGLQQAPAAGRAAAELVLEGQFTTLNLTRFGFERISAGEPMFEANIV